MWKTLMPQVEERVDMSRSATLNGDSYSAGKAGQTESRHFSIAVPNLTKGIIILSLPRLML
jgi:hypothetical protein